MAIIKEMQQSCEYSDSRFHQGVIGNFRPPAELAEYDEDYLDPFTSNNPFDLSPPPHAGWQLQKDYRRRALRQLYAEHVISARSYLVRLHTLRYVISEVMKASARKEMEEQLQQQIVERLNPNVPPDSSINDSDPSYSPPPDIIPPAATVVGVPCDDLPPPSHSSCPSPDYHNEPDQVPEGASPAAEPFRDDVASQASNLPVSNLSEAFSEVAQPAALAPQQPSAPAPPQAALPAASIASSQAITTDDLPRDIADDDPRNENYPRSVDEAFDRVKAMKRWMAAGDMNVAAFCNRLNLLHQDFSGLQQLLNREQEEITSREERRRTVHWGPPTEAPFRQPRQSNPTQGWARSASIEAQVTRESPRGQGWSTGSTSGPSDSTSGWGNSASARARSDNAWRSGPASVSANSLTPDRSRSPHQSQQSQSESPRDSGNNHDNHRKWQRPLNNTPPPDADFSDRGRNRDRRATDRNVASHDRANRSRSATPDDSRGTDRRHYLKPISNSPRQSSSSSHIPSRKPHVRTDHRDPKSQSIALPFKPPHQRYQVNHRSSVNDGRKPPLLTASPQVSSKRDRTFTPPPDHPSLNKRHQRIPSSQLAAPHVKQSGQTHQRSIPPRSSPFANPPVTHRASHHPPISHISVTHLPPTANTGATPRLVPMPPPPPVAPRPPTLPPSPPPPAATVSSPLSALLSTYRHAVSASTFSHHPLSVSHSLLLRLII